jgi:hypothetical protein
MSAGKLLQLLGFLGVSFVLFASLTSERSMLFEFGGLAAGAAVFLIGRALEPRGK